MFITVHSTVGIALAQIAPNPLFAFFTGYASHFLFDLIPHGDELFSSWPLKKFVKIALLDHVVAVFNLSLLFYFTDVALNATLIAAVIGALLPDWIMGFYQLTRCTSNSMLTALHALIKPAENIHYFNHKKIITRTISFKYGLIIQLLTLILLWIIITRFS